MVCQNIKLLGSKFPVWTTEVRDTLLAIQFEELTLK